MRNLFEKIENQIENLIEGGVQLFPWTPAEKTVIVAIIHEIRNQIFKKMEQATRLPNKFSISVHQQIFSTLDSDQYWVQEIIRMLSESAEEYDYYFAGDIKVEFVTDPIFMNINEFKVDTSFSIDEIEKTAVIKPSIKKEENKRNTLTAYLLLPNKDTFALKTNITQIGRKNDNHLIIDNPTVSRNHAHIRYINGNYVLFDLNSTSGTYVNGIKINQALLRPGDVISIANYPLVYAEESDFNDIDKGSTAEIPRIEDKK